MPILPQIPDPFFVLSPLFFFLNMHTVYICAVGLWRLISLHVGERVRGEGRVGSRDAWRVSMKTPTNNKKYVPSFSLVRTQPQGLVQGGES